MITFKQKNITPKKIIVSVLIIAILFVAGFTLLYSFNQNLSTPKQTEPSDTVTPEPESESTKDNDQQLVPDETIPQTGNPDVNNNPNVEINVPSYQINGNELDVNVAINAPWGSDAICTMKLSGAQTIVVTANAFAQAQISGCQLEVGNLNPGEYVISIYAERNNSRTNELKLNISI